MYPHQRSDEVPRVVVEMRRAADLVDDLEASTAAMMPDGRMHGSAPTERSNLSPGEVASPEWG
jgi:hypothetical protein